MEVEDAREFPSIRIVNHEKVYFDDVDMEKLSWERNAFQRVLISISGIKMGVSLDYVPRSHRIDIS